MRYVFVVNLLLSASCLFGQIEWQALPDAPNFIGALSKLDDVHFIDPEIGWTINSFGEVFKTINGGDNWENKGNLGEFFNQ